MARRRATSAVVVGIDGSRAAVTAARWALDEAVSREVPLRLVSVIDAPAESCAPEMEYAEESLRGAAATVHELGKPVKVDTAVRWGVDEVILLEESESAAMVCVGTVGIGRVAHRLLGSTAVALATGARCAVAIIRRKPPPEGWVVVLVDHRPGNDDVVQQAMDEARLRKAPLLALGVGRWDLDAVRYHELEERIGGWRERYPDVCVQRSEAPGGAVEYLDTRNKTVQLLVTGSVNANELTRLIGPHSHPILDHPACSVLVVRSE